MSPPATKLSASPQAVRLATVEAQLDSHEKFCTEFRADQKQLNRQIVNDIKELRKTVYMLIGALAALEIGLSFWG